MEEKQDKSKRYLFSVAPMMDWTDRHCRVFHRLMTRRARLYTEMVTTGAVIHGDRKRLLGFDPSEHPLALQIGGSDPRDLATSARIGEDFGYDEINLNVGCPSDRVKDGRFGACLMAEPDLVARGVAAMKAVVGIPVTVKCRIGIDDQDPELALDALARGVVAAGADALIVHARKAWLNGLSPKENRDIPPLDYDRVYRLKAALPGVPIIINGGIAGIAEATCASRPCRWCHAGARSLSGAVAIARGRSRIVRRGGAAAIDEGGIRCDDAVHRGSAGARHQAAFDQQAFRRCFPWRARGAGVPSPSRRERCPAGRRNERAARCYGAGRWPRHGGRERSTIGVVRSGPAGRTSINLDRPRELLAWDRFAQTPGKLAVAAGRRVESRFWTSRRRIRPSLTSPPYLS